MRVTVDLGTRKDGDGWGLYGMIMISRIKGLRKGERGRCLGPWACWGWNVWYVTGTTVSQEGPCVVIGGGVLMYSTMASRTKRTLRV